MTETCGKWGVDSEMPVGLENWLFNCGVGVGAGVEAVSKERQSWPRCVGGETQTVTQVPCISGTTCANGLPMPFCMLSGLSRLCMKILNISKAMYIVFILSH